MSLNSFPNPPKKQGDLANKVETPYEIQGVLENRVDVASNEETIDDQTPFVGYAPKPKHSFPLLEPIYPNSAFLHSQRNRELFKDVADTQLDQLRSVDISPDSKIFNLLDGCYGDEKRVLIDGIIYGNGMLHLVPNVYRYCDYFQNFGKSLFLILGTARGFENNLASEIEKVFDKEKSLALHNRIRDLYRKQIEEIIRKSLAVVGELYREADDVEYEHSVYDDRVTTDYITGIRYEDESEKVPEVYKYAENLIDQESPYLAAKIQERHASVLKKIESEIANVSKELVAINLSALLFLGTFRSLKESGVAFSLEDIKGSNFSRETLGGDITSAQVTEMKSIYFQNQSANPAVQKELVDKFSETLADGKSRFYSFTYHNAVQSFVAFTPKEDGAVFASAFNVAPAARGYKIGEAMLHEAIDREASTHVLVGNCDSKLPISSKYIETGWVATRYWDDHGDKILDIVRDDARRDSFVGKGLTVDDIISGNVPAGVVVAKTASQDTLPFERCNEGQVLTRMFFDSKTNSYYGVFESASPSRTE